MKLLPRRKESERSKKEKELKITSSTKLLMTEQKEREGLKLKKRLRRTPS